MTGRTSGLGMTGRGPTSASTAWAVPGHADAPVWLTSPAASPRELPPGYGTLPPRQRHTVARLSCSSVRCWGGQPGDCGPDTNRLAVHEQRLDRKMCQDRREQHGDCVRLGAESQWRTGDGNTMSGRCVCHDRFRDSQSTSARSAVKAWPKASICSIEVSSSAARSACGLPPSSCQAIRRHPSRVGAPYINRASLG